MMLPKIAYKVTQMRNQIIMSLQNKTSPILRSQGQDLVALNIHLASSLTFCYIFENLKNYGGDV